MRRKTPRDTAPPYSLTHASGGKTITQVIPRGPAVDRTRAQIATAVFASSCKNLSPLANSSAMLSCSSRKRRLQWRVKKKLLAHLLATDVVQEIETLLSRQAVEDLDLEALELAVRQQALQLAGAAVEQRLNADTSDEQGSRIRCGCGQEARLVGRRSKQVQSVLGPLQLERAYYHCSSCGHGCCPRDEHLGIENTTLSPALTRMIGTVGAMVSFQEGGD